MQLRYLQTLNNISAEKNSTIVFPIPIDIVSQLVGQRQPPPPPTESPQCCLHHTSNSAIETLVH